jgi:hypothetical protein
MEIAPEGTFPPSSLRYLESAKDCVIPDVPVEAISYQTVPLYTFKTPYVVLKYNAPLTPVPGSAAPDPTARPYLPGSGLKIMLEGTVSPDFLI